MLKETLDSKNISSIRVPFVLNRRVSTLDPLRINTITEATILRHLYSSLFDYDESGRIQTDLVKKFEWQDRKLAIQLKTEAIASDGEKVSVKDAMFSLKRLMLDGGNLHGDLKEILCPNYHIKSIHDPCPGIWTEGETLFLEAHSEILTKNLIPLLASVDYRIIPERAFDQTTTIPKIQNFRVTSGTYFLETEDETGSFVLSANKHHHYYHKKMPQQVIGVPLGSKRVAELMLGDEVDVVPTTTPVTLEELEEINRGLPNVRVEKTHPLRIRLFMFGKKAIKDFSIDQRLRLAQILLERHKNLKLPFEVPTVQLFQEFGEGFLSEAEQSEVYKKREELISIRFPRRPTVGVTKQNLHRWGEFFEKNKEVSPAAYDVHAVELSLDERPDIFSGLTDVSFNTTVVALSYNLKQGYFGLFGKDVDNWIRNFLNTPGKDEQLKKIHELHLAAIKNVYIFPISSSPYFSISNSKWQVKLNPYFSATPLWLARAN